MQQAEILKRQLERWYPLKDVAEQIRLINAVDNGIRFPVVPAGRRSGKTERLKRFTVKRANLIEGPYFLGAPTRGQAKKIFWDDLKLLSLSCCHRRKPNETDLIVYPTLPGGRESEIHVVGLDEPSRMEGIPWKGGGIDEIASIKPKAWSENIYPALLTENPLFPDYKAWCWLIGVPEGINHFYDLAEYAKNSKNPEWDLFHWKSSEVLSAEALQAAREIMSLKQYLQEFEASFQTISGRIYSDYDDENVTDRELKEHDLIHWHHDFNYTPLSSGIGVVEEKKIYIVDEIVLESAVSKESALEFCEMFENHKNKKVRLYGDASGKAGEKHSQESEYSIIEGILREKGWNVDRRVPEENPPIKDRQNAVRAKVKNASGERSFFVNAIKAPTMHKGFSTVQLKEGSTFIEADSYGQHITTAAGYFINYDFPINFEKMQSVRPGGI